MNLQLNNEANALHLAVLQVVSYDLCPLILNFDYQGEKKLGSMQTNAKSVTRIRIFHRPNSAWHPNVQGLEAEHRRIKKTTVNFVRFMSDFILTISFCGSAEHNDNNQTLHEQAQC